MQTVILILVLLLNSIYAGVLPVERQIAASRVECGAGWTPAGTLIFSRCGLSEWEFQLTDSEGDVTAFGGVFTHNHPGENGACWTLSPGDVQAAEAYQWTEVRAVSIRNGLMRVDSMRRAGNIFPYIPQDVINAEASAQLVRDDHPETCDYIDRTWAALAPRYGLIYHVYAVTVR